MYIVHSQSFSGKPYSFILVVANLCGNLLSGTIFCLHEAGSAEFGAFSYCCQLLSFRVLLKILKLCLQSFFKGFLNTLCWARNGKAVRELSGSSRNLYFGTSGESWRPSDLWNSTQKSAIVAFTGSTTGTRNQPVWAWLGLGSSADSVWDLLCL